jgi:N-acetylneuraminic acid mutarotase
MRLTRGRKWLVLFGCAALSLVLSGASNRAQAESPIHHTFKPPKSLDHPYVPGEVLVKFKESPATFRGKPSRKHLNSLHGTAAAEFVAALPTRAQASLERVQGQVVRAHPSIGVLRVKLPAQVSVGQAIDALYRSGAVEYAEPNGLIKLQGTPDDPLFTSQWALPQIMAPEAWELVYPGNVIPPGSKNTIVAVIDTGVDYLHEDFYVTLNDPPVHRYTLPADPALYFPGDPLTSNFWLNHGEEVTDPYNPTGPKVFIKNNVDDDDNHFVDDYFGINTYVSPTSGDPMDPPPSSGGHGSAMAGIIGAVGNNGRGMTGVNWQTRIMALRFANASGGTVENAITCINYALSQHSKEGAPMVLTLGWSQNPSYKWDNSLHDALRIAQDSGVLVVAAAGNNNEDNDIFPNYPSSYNHDPQDFPAMASITPDNIISVGGSDQFDKRVTVSSTVGSSYGMATVDLFAPGKDIVCTITPPATPTPPPIHTTYGSGTGTSFAAAHVAGACALLWNRYPDKDWKQIKALVMNGVEDGEAQDFRAICVTEGRLNLKNSLEADIKTPAVFSIFEVTPVSGEPTIVPGRADTNDTLVITGVNFGSSPGVLSFLGMSFPAAPPTNWEPDVPYWTDEKIVTTVPAGLPKGTGRLLVTKVTEAGVLTSRGACFSNISRERQVGSLIMGRGLAASAQVNQDVWVIGGRTYWGIVGQVEKYSLDTNHTVVDSDWMMPTPVSNAGAASIGAKIYVVGGLWEDPVTAATSLMSNLQIFDTTTQTWEAGPPLPKALMQCAMTSVGGKLYVFGGMATTTSVARDAYVFDPATNAWSVLTDLPTATAYAAAALTAAGKIWVMGGFSSSNIGSQQSIVQEYDPAANAWTQKSHLVRPRGGAAGINYGGQVYCLHGTKYPPITPTTAVYDAYSDGEWYSLARAYWMPSIMNYLGIFVAPAKVLDRKGLYTPSPGKHLDKIFLLGGVTGTESDYKYSYSNKVWAFPAPSGVGSRSDITPVLNLLLSPD